MALIGIFGICHSQSAANPFPPLDKSPMDISYYPDNYPILKINGKATEPPIARIIYSRPQKGDRTIFGGLVEYGQVWRLGANEATEIEFYKDVKIAGQKIPKGRYTLFALVNPDSWTLIINKETDTWGAFKYDSKKDLLRVSVPVEKLSEQVEPLSIMFEKTNKGFNLVIGWDMVEVKMPVALKQ
jgi:hypothetical protein